MADQVNETAVQEMSQAVCGLQEWATSLIVATKDDAQQAMARVAEIKGAKKRWLDYWAPLKTAAAAAHKAICAKENEGTTIADAAERTVKTKVIAWQEAERQKAEAEQRRLQAIADEQARREREKAEAAARIQREKEATAQREAEAARQAAAAEQDKTKREQLQREAEKRQAEANAAAAKAAQREEAAAVVQAPVISVTPQKVASKGTSTRTIWSAQLIDKAALLAAALADPAGVAASLVTFDQQAADKLARAMTGSLTVPGVKFVSSQTMSVRSI